jgi:hypothetical protein
MSVRMTDSIELIECTASRSMLIDVDMAEAHTCLLTQRLILLLLPPLFLHLRTSTTCKTA